MRSVTDWDKEVRDSLRRSEERRSSEPPRQPFWVLILGLFLAGVGSAALIRLITVDEVWQAGLLVAFVTAVVGMFLVEGYRAGARTPRRKVPTLEVKSGYRPRDFEPSPAQIEQLRCCRCGTRVAGSPRFCPKCHFTVFEIAIYPALYDVSDHFDGLGFYERDG